MTQAALSQHIKILEIHSGVQLFIRETWQVSLTEGGKRLIPFIKAGFENLNQGVVLLTHDATPNVLNVRVTESFSKRWLVPRLQIFQEQYPEIRGRLEPCNKVHGFIGTDIDLTIRFGEGIYPGLESRCLLKDKYVLVCHPSAYFYYVGAPSHHFSKPKVCLFEKWLVEAVTAIH